MRRLLVALLSLMLTASTFGQVPSKGGTYRPVIRGTRAVVAGGQPLTVEAGLRMLHRGGNAVDAGVAATLAASVIEFSHFAFGGEVALMVKLANQPVMAINGQGTAPRLATREYFEQHTKEQRVPSAGPLSATVPAVLDAMVVALDRFGTMTLADVLQPAIELADGFPIDELRVQYIVNTRQVFEQWPESRAVFLPGGAVPRVGDLFVQKDLARALRELVSVERQNTKKGRHAALEAARDYFYKGAMAQRIGRAMEQAGGLLRASDLAEFHAEVDRPAVSSFQGFEVYKVGFWSQGPVMLEALNLLEGYDLRKMGPNSIEYIHTLVEALKLSFADRDRYYGDPRFARVPGDELLSKDYAALRRSLIDPQTASLEQRPGDPVNKKALAALTAETSMGASRVPEAERAHDTTCVNVVDSKGNIFSATPSGAWLPAVVAGDTGIPMSSRLQSFLMSPGHPNELQPGKRPRITLSPTIVLKDGQPFAALSTPGGDNQDQALIQVLFNVILFGMNPQQAVEAPRFETTHLVSSFDDHKFNPGVLRMESRLQSASDALKQKGHKIEFVDDYAPLSAPTIIIYDPKTRIIQGGADVRRGRYAAGW
jgi:gamma-glutamyltranspeptidase / glutathione hydrolase